MEKKTCSDELIEYKNQVLEELKERKAYGGFEGKLEDGKLTYFKHWVGKKI